MSFAVTACQNETGSAAPALEPAAEVVGEKNCCLWKPFVEARI